MVPQGVVLRHLSGHPLDSLFFVPLGAVLNAFQKKESLFWNWENYAGPEPEHSLFYAGLPEGGRVNRFLQRAGMYSLACDSALILSPVFGDMPYNTSIVYRVGVEVGQRRMVCNLGLMGKVAVLVGGLEMKFWAQAFWTGDFIPLAGWGVMSRNSIPETVPIL